MKSSAHDLEGKSPRPRQPYRCRASSLIALTSFLSPPMSVKDNLPGIFEVAKIVYVYSGKQRMVL